MLIDFLLKEWLLVVSGVGLVLTSVYIGHSPPYSMQEMEVLFILFALFVAVRGLQRSGLMSGLSQHIEKGAAVPCKLVAATFFLSMLVTNDIALMVIVPITLSLNTKRRDILVILEALAANAGSALTPFGNPQNLYIYWFYNLHPVKFITAIAPFSSIFLIIFIFASFTIRTDNGTQEPMAAVKIDKSSYIYGILIILVLLSVLHILPVSTGILVIIYAILLDRKSLHVDYSLLVSFFFFFGLAENMKVLLAADIKHSGHVFLFSALASQIMSNVPATLLFAKFTSNWKALLWGTNVGGFGGLFGSLANLIAYRLYVKGDTDNHASFTMVFLVIGYAAFFCAIGLYFTLQYYFVA